MQGSAPTSPKKKRTAAFSFAKKPTKGDPKAMAEWKLEQERMAREKEEKEGRDHGDDAKKAVFKSDLKYAFKFASKGGFKCSFKSAFKITFTSALKSAFKNKFKSAF